MVKKCSRKVSVAACVALVGVASAQDAPIAASTPMPAVTEMETPGMCAVDGWEFVGRWNPADNGKQIEGLEDCAAACAADEFCSGTTHIDFDDETDTPTCWFKQWGPGMTANPCEPSEAMTANKAYTAIIKPPPGKTCATLEFMADGPYTCESEGAAFDEGADISDEPIGIAGDAAGPAAAAAVPEMPAGPVMIDAVALKDAGYAVFTGFDYSPVQEPAPPAGAIVDLEMGTNEEDAVACATRCTGAADDGCNAFSWYGDNPEATWPGGFNCYIKVLDGCTLPADAAETGDNASFVILACEGEEIVIEAAPAPAPQPVPLLPTDEIEAPAPVDALPPLVDEDDDDLAPPPLGTPVSPVVGSREAGGTPPTGDAPVVPDGAMPLATTAAALAAAAAAALL